VTGFWLRVMAYGLQSTGLRITIAENSLTVIVSGLRNSGYGLRVAGYGYLVTVFKFHVFRDSVTGNGLRLTE
jgi:hypothetical protein